MGGGRVLQAGSECNRLVTSTAFPTCASGCQIVPMRIHVLLVAVALFYSLTVAGQTESRCPDPKLRQAEIGGDRIVGVVLRQAKPVKLAPIKVYSLSTGKIAWVWTTDRDGRFTSEKLAPGSYRIEVRGWGSAIVKLNPKLDRTEGTGQEPNWSLSLTDGGCVSAGWIVD